MNIFRKKRLASYTWPRPTQKKKEVKVFAAMPPPLAFAIWSKIVDSIAHFHFLKFIFPLFDLPLSVCYLLLKSLHNGTCWTHFHSKSHILGSSVRFIELEANIANADVWKGGGLIELVVWRIVGVGELLCGNGSIFLKFLRSCLLFFVFVSVLVSVSVSVPLFLTYGFCLRLLVVNLLRMWWQWLVLFFLLSVFLFLFFLAKLSVS